MAHQSGFTHESPRNETAEWYTPPYVFDALGLLFDLDPCSPGKDIVPWLPAEQCYTKADDGLTREWTGRVWLNPPYGQETPRWLARLADHGNGIALVFARTDTGWFHESVTQADLVCFIKGRIKFLKPDGTEDALGLREGIQASLFFGLRSHGLRAFARALGIFADGRVVDRRADCRAGGSRWPTRCGDYRPRLLLWPPPLCG